MAVPSMFAGVAECGGEFLVPRPLSDQAFDDRRSRLRGDRPNIAHRRTATFCDRLLGGGYPLVQLRLEPFMQLLGFARLLLARGAGNRLGAAPGVPKRLFVSRFPRVRPVFPL